MLTKAQVKQFREQGYLIVPGLDPAMLEPLRQGSAAKVEVWLKVPMEEASDRYTVHFRPGIDDGVFFE